MGSRIAIIGTGYVGLTTGACFAHLGHDVVCADIDPRRSSGSTGRDPDRRGRASTSSSRRASESGRLRFVLGAGRRRRATASSSTSACPTPQGDDGSADLSYIEAAAREIGPRAARRGRSSSTSRPCRSGSTRVVERALGRADVFVVSNPEFLREGSAVHDFLHPDRVVIGSDDQAAAIRVAALYLGVAAPLIVTDPASAETIKYAANAFLATKISLRQRRRRGLRGGRRRRQRRGARHGLRQAHRPRVPRPGPGWGGCCFPKDTQALVRIAEDAGYDFDLLKGVIAVNEEQFERVDREGRAAWPAARVDGVVVAVWGLTFKARTDDLRDSPSLEIMRRLHERGAKVRAYDPAVPQSTEHPLLAGIEVCADPYAACARAPRCSRCSPSGTSSGGSTSTRSAS